MFVSLRAPRSFALAAGLSLIMGAYAADGHGADAHASDAHGASESAHKPSAKAAHAPAAHAEPAAAPAKAAEPAGSTVSMADLRELLDQKIAEVRAKREAAPAVRVVSRSAKAKRPAPEPTHVAYRSGPHDANAHSSVPMPPGGVQGHDIHWAYAGDTGPANWGTLKPEFQTCMLGRRQSPIDIRDGIKVSLEPIIFDYRPTPFRVIDNGHTIQVNVEQGNSILIQGRRFDLIQFHFHRPSEERVNGRQSDMVIHMVHKDVDGKLAVVAVLLNQGEVPNPMVQLVWNSLPLEKNVEQYSPVMMDLNYLLPEHREYYTYMGSLTTPPCTEGVLWMVMKQPTTLTRDQIGIFSRLYPMNARPIQSSGGRMIKEGM